MSPQSVLGRTKDAERTQQVHLELHTRKGQDWTDHHLFPRLNWHQVLFLTCLLCYEHPQASLRPLFREKGDSYSEAGGQWAAGGRKLRNELSDRPTGRVSLLQLRRWDCLPGSTAGAEKRERQRRQSQSETRSRAAASSHRGPPSERPARKAPYLNPSGVGIIRWGLGGSLWHRGTFTGRGLFRWMAASENGDKGNTLKGSTGNCHARR